MTDAELAVVVKLKDLFSKQLNSIVKNTDTSAKKMESSWKRLTTTMSAAKAIAVGWATGQIARAIGNMVEFTAAVDKSNVAFGAMSRRIGMDATEAIARMRKAAGGAVADMNLMSAANRAIMLGAVRTTDELEKLTLYGTKLGQAMGLTAAQGIDFFTTGLARQSNAILDNVGLIISLEREYARLGKTAGDLTEEQRRGIFQAAVWRDAAAAVATLGDKVASTSIAVAKAAAAIENFKKALADMVLPELPAWLERITNIFEAWSGKYGVSVLDIIIDKLTKIRDLMNAVGRFGTPGMGAGTWGVGQAPPTPAPIGTTPTPAQGKAVFQPPVPLPSLTYWEEKETAAGWLEQQKAAMQDSWSEVERLTEDFQIYMFDMQQETESVLEASWRGIRDGVEEYFAAASNAAQNFHDTVIRLFMNLEDALGNVFFDAMMGKLKSFKDYLRAFVQDIGRTLSQLMARLALQQLMSGAMAGFGALFGPAAVTTTGDFPARLQSGGITSGLSLAGEAGPEAVVPLPGSRHIPVELMGNRGGNVTYIINAIDTQSFAQALMTSRASVHKIVTEGLGSDTQLRSAVRAV